jgi:hypothetical protein
MGSTPFSRPMGAGRAGSRDWDDVTDVVERCRVSWLLAGLPGTRADNMATELETHLREQRADGGRVEDVVGADLGEFAAAWATSARSVHPRTWTAWAIVARLSGVLLTVALYAFVVLLVDAFAADGQGTIRTSDLLLFGLLVASQEVLGGPRATRRVVVSGPRTLALLAAGVVVVGPVVTPLLARTFGPFGSALFTLGWPGAILLALLAALATGVSLLQPRDSR